MTTIPDRVFIGNLDYNSTVLQLNELLKDCNVNEVEIPTKSQRHNDGKVVVRQLGFAFAQFSNEDDADNAIKRFDGEKFNGRQIFLKKATPPATEEEKEAKIQAFKEKREAYLAKKEEDKLLKKDGVSKVPKGDPSNDTIFITNLDFKVNKSLLHSTFKELKPVWIHIPSKRSGTHRGFNKGIAFVKFSSEEIQKQAIKEFNGREINGREIVVDVAINTTKPKNVEVSEEAS